MYTNCRNIWRETSTIRAHIKASLIFIIALARASVYPGDSSPHSFFPPPRSLSLSFSSPFSHVSVIITIIICYSAHVQAPILITVEPTMYHKSFCTLNQPFLKLLPWGLNLYMRWIEMKLIFHSSSVPLFFLMISQMIIIGSFVSIFCGKFFSI